MKAQKTTQRKSKASSSLNRLRRHPAAKEKGPGSVKAKIVRSKPSSVTQKAPRKRPIKMPFKALMKNLKTEGIEKNNFFQRRRSNKLYGGSRTKNMRNTLSSLKSETSRAKRPHYKSPTLNSRFSEILAKRKTSAQPSSSLISAKHQFRSVDQRSSSVNGRSPIKPKRSKKRSTGSNNHQKAPGPQRGIQSLIEHTRGTEPTPENPRSNSETTLGSLEYPLITPDLPDEPSILLPQELRDRVTVYAANTNNGLYRDYNEDRVAIVLNIVPEPQEAQNSVKGQKTLSDLPFGSQESKKHKRHRKSTWEIEQATLTSRTQSAQFKDKISFFGLYDGHGGAGCANFLMDNLHVLVTHSPYFGNNKKKAFLDGILKAETEFKKKALRAILAPSIKENLQGLANRSKSVCLTNQSTSTLNSEPKKQNLALADPSGSCACVCLISRNTCYTANVGDSRMILSAGKGFETAQITEDHRPSAPTEKERILKHGGSLVRKETIVRCQLRQRQGTNSQSSKKVDKVILGPYRVSPGGLSVSRTIGDFHAKLAQFGGNRNCVIPIPDVRSFEIAENTDFLMIGCDGIFDVLSNEEVNDCVWRTIRGFDGRGIASDSRLEKLGEKVTEGVIRLAMEKDSGDNLTVVLMFMHDYDYYTSQ